MLVRGRVWAKLQWERLNRERHEVERLRVMVADEQRTLNGWLNSNRSSTFHNAVSQASSLLVAQEVGTLAKAKDKLADLQALNKALENKGVDDLVERARENLAYANPLAMALGGSLALVALSVMVVGVVIACPPLAVLGLAALWVGLSSFSMGSDKVTTPKAEGLFRVAKEIDRSLSRESDLLGMADEMQMPPLSFDAI